MRRSLFGFAAAAVCACSLVTSLDDLRGDGGTIGPLEAGSDAPGDTASCTGGLTSCGGKCVDLGADDLNCGSCGRTCGGTKCTAGACAAATVVNGLSNPYVLRSATTPDVLVVASDDPLVDGGTTGGIYRVAKPSGPATRMWTSPFYVVAPNSDLALNGTEAYFIGRTGSQYDAFSVKLTDPPGDQPSSRGLTLNSTYHGVDAIRIDGGVDFVAAGRDYGTRVVGGGPVVDITLTGGDDLILPRALPYVVMNNRFEGTIIRCDRVAAQCTPTEVYKGPFTTDADHFQIEGSNLYWAASDGQGVYSVLACALPGPCSVPVIIANGEGQIHGLVVDATGAYWTDAVGGRIRRCSDITKGCAGSAATLATGEANAWGITTDATNVYWSIRSTQGSIRRVAK